MCSSSKTAKIIYNNFHSGHEAEPGGRIVNGVEAEYGEFPHMVMVQLADRFRCGGSLIFK